MNRNLASGLNEGTIRICNIDNEGYIKTLIGHCKLQLFVCKLQLLQSGELISCSADHKVKIWDLNKGSCIKTLVSQNDTVSSILVTQTGTFISRSHFGPISIWYKETGLIMIGDQKIEGFPDLVRVYLKC